MAIVNHLRCPVVVDEVAYCAIVQPKRPREVNHYHCFAFKFNAPVVAFVSVLLCACFPSAVFWAVVSEVIDSSQRMCIAWPSAHILDEVFESVFAEPSFANFNPFRSIVCIAFILLVVASLSHRPEQAVFRESVKTMPCYSPEKFFVPEAAATFAFSVFQVASRNHCGVATRTLAIPHAFSQGSRSFTNDDKSPECFPSKVDKTH